MNTSKPTQGNTAPVKEEIISKEETMYSMGPDGKLIPEKYPIQIYDREIDIELAEEAITLMNFTKREKSQNDALTELKQKQAQELTNLKKKIEQVKDDKEKIELETELRSKEDMIILSEFKERSNTLLIEGTLKESRELIAKLNKKKEELMVIEYAEILPCTNAESVYSFEKHKSLEGKDTEFWTEELIVAKVANPEYKLDEAKQLKKDYKDAYREAIMKVSGYTLKSYRDIILEKQMEELPQKAKKDEPNLNA